MSHVIDASATIAWLLNENGLGPVLEIYHDQETPVVPWLWRLEVANTLLVMQRRRKLKPDRVDEHVTRIDKLDVEVAPEPAGRTLADLVALARPHQLSAYDATYLDLAKRRGLPLATLDNNLRQPAAREGVDVPDVN